MARGDLITDIVTVEADSTKIFQPAVGVEIMITGIVLKTGGLCCITDGTTTSDYMSESLSVKIGITNSNYLEFGNTASGTRAQFYSGVQTK
jgi:hypothetical protein